MKAFPLRMLALLLCATTAFATELKSDYDRSFNLSKLRSFRFADQSRRAPKDTLAENELVAKRLRTAIQNNVVALGMVQQDAQPDFEIAYYAGVRNRTQVTTSGLPRLGLGNVWVDQYAEGTAIVEFRDPNSQAHEARSCPQRSARAV